MRLVSIRTQLLLALAFIGAVFLVVGALAIVNEQIRQSHEHAEREIVTMTNLAQGSLNRALRYEIPTAVNEILVELSANRRVRNVLKVDNSGRITQAVSDYEQHATGRPITAIIPRANLQYFDNALATNKIFFHIEPEFSRYIVYVPVVAANGEFGRPARQLVIFEYEHRVSWQSALAARQRAIILAAAFLILWFFALATFLQKRITQPVEQLSLVMKKLEQGEVVEEIPVHGRTELAGLARITEQMIRERFRNESKINLLSTALEQSNEGVIITSLEPKIEYVNRALLQNTGYREHELIGQNPSMLGSGKTPKTTFLRMWKHLLSGKPWTGELLNKRKDGSEYSELQTISPVRDSSGEIVHYLGVKQDITEQKNTQERLHFLAYFNHLTYLPNRLSLIEKIGEISIKSKASNDYWLILLNIDRMKRINDARGYDYGNTVINAVAKRIQNFLPQSAYLAHTGADNFACLLSFKTKEKHPVERVNDFAWELKGIIDEPLDVYGERVQLTMSLGLSRLTQSASAEDMFRQAETALHKAKENGGNEVSIYSQGDVEQAENLFGLERDLHYAVENDQIAMYLQGQFDATGKLVGAEALARWQHPTEGMIPPDKFIVIAERSDLIIQLDRNMLKHAANCMAKLQQNNQHLSFSVNVSPRYFRSKQLKTDLQAIFNAANVGLKGLVLEVTERLCIDDMHEVIEQMVGISELGVQFALDDFGTGYSSLAYLQRLPIHELKIDHSFTQGLPNNKRDVAMVNMVTAIARNLDLRVVAEGVETREQREYFEGVNVLMQGYYFDRPQPEYEWLRKWCP